MVVFYFIRAIGQQLLEVLAPLWLHAFIFNCVQYEKAEVPELLIAGR